jgi:dolichol-phosphate mannosyltransferase
MSRDMARVLVSPVAFNEELKIRNVIERFLKSPLFRKVDFLIVDDASSDRTTTIIQGYDAQDVKTIRHRKRRGVGASIRTAVDYAREKKYDILVIMAGNDKDDPDEIPLLLKALDEGYDFVQGSRYHDKKGVLGDMPFYRKTATRLHPVFLSLLTGQKVTDSTNGFRAFRLSLFNDAQINIRQRWLDGYELEPYLFYKVLKLRYNVKEVPVTKIYPPRKSGYTKMKPVLGWWSILKPLVYLGLGIKK